MAIKVKAEFQNKVIGFNKSCLPLGKRDDFMILYNSAKRKGHKQYLNMFEETSEPSITQDRASAFLKSQADKKS